MPLQFVKPGAEPHLNVCLFGPPKSGKTVGAASAPKPLLLLNADRPNATRYVHAKYGDVATHLERFCRSLCEAPLNAVLVTWESLARDERTGEFEVLPATGTSNTNPAQKLASMVDVIGYTGVVEEEGGSTRYMAQLLPGRGRRAGNRYVSTLGASRDVDVAEWVKLVKKATAPKAVREEKAAA